MFSLFIIVIISFPYFIIFFNMYQTSLYYYQKYNFILYESIEIFQLVTYMD